MELHLRAMIVVGGPHRAHYRDVIDAFGNLRPPVADLYSALTAFFEAHLQGIQAGMNLVEPGDDLAQVLLDERIFLKVLERRIAQTITTELIQSRFGIERLHVADAANHEQPDDTLGFRGEMRFAVRRLPARRGRPNDSVSSKNRPERKSSEAHSEICEEVPAGRGAKSRVCLHKLLLHRIVTKSLWLSRT